MTEFKLVISTKDGKTVQREVKDKEASSLINKKIGDLIKGESIGIAGYELQITGGSDHCGFPMRKDVGGKGRKKILAVSGIGIKNKRPGQRQRKTVCGNTVHVKIAQINFKVTKEGKASLSAPVEAAQEQEKLETKEKPKEQEKPETKEKPKEQEKPEAKEKPKEQEKPEAKEKPKEQEKPEAKE